MYKYLKQGFSFIIISGIGWIIDFSIYFAITALTDIYVLFANIMSAIPAITFVFFVSTKKTFIRKKGRCKLAHKYLIYFLYQIILLLCISSLVQALYNYFSINIIYNTFLVNNLKIIIKILVTPITMVANFIVMKLLIEKL